MKTRTIRLTLCLLLTLALTAALTGCGGRDEPLSEKPVLYLYPEEETEVPVTLEVDRALSRT